jgi:hypothetical protein
MNDFTQSDYSNRLFEGEQFNDMTTESALASLNYYQSAFDLDIHKLVEGDESEWAKTKQYPPSFMMLVEQLMCRLQGQDQT